MLFSAAANTVILGNFSGVTRSRHHRCGKCRRLFAPVNARRRRPSQCAHCLLKPSHIFAMCCVRYVFLVSTDISALCLSITAHVCSQALTATPLPSAPPLPPPPPLPSPPPPLPSAQSQVWAMSDPLGNGVLDREGFFTAAKLVALAQAGLDIAVENCTAPTELPQFVSVVFRFVAPL